MMNSTQATRAGKTTLGRAASRDVGGMCGDERRDGKASAVRPRPKRAGYGLPCANCRTYYAADLPQCPVCKATVRVSPKATGIAKAASEAVSEKYGDDVALEAAREAFLRELREKVDNRRTQARSTAEP